MSFLIRCVSVTPVMDLKHILKTFSSLFCYRPKFQLCRAQLTTTNLSLLLSPASYSSLHCLVPPTLDIIPLLATSPQFPLRLSSPHESLCSLNTEVLSIILLVHTNVGTPTNKHWDCSQYIHTLVLRPVYIAENF